MKTYSKCINFASLNGLTFTKIEVDTHDNVLRFFTDDKVYICSHDQDCCEQVYIEDICGDINDLIGVPIIRAEEVCSTEEPGKDLENEYSYQWTFYKLVTEKGYVTIRWYGSSNGCYSVNVDTFEMYLKDFL